MAPVTKQVTLALGTLFASLACASTPFIQTKNDYVFPEERSRATWDLGCDDWPVAVASHSRVKSNPEFRIDRRKGLYRFWITMRIRKEPGETASQIRQSIEQILWDPSTYPGWVLPGLNESPAGSQYFVTIDGITPKVVRPGYLFHLTGPYTFHVLWFKRTGFSTVEFKTDLDYPPKCEAFSRVQDQKLQKTTFRMVPRPEILKMLIAEVWAVPDEAEWSLRIRLVMEPSELIYQILPERMLQTQLEERGRRIAQNFLEARKRAVVPAASSGAQDFGSNVAAPPK